MEEEVRKGRKDFGKWMRREEPRGFRGGTKDFRENVTIIRERAGVMAAEEDRKRLGEAEFERRFEARRARFGGGAAAAAAAAADIASTSELRKDSGVISGGEEDSDEDVMVVGTEPPKEVSFTMRELEKTLAKGKGKGPADTRAWVGRGTPPTRQQMISWLVSVDEEELARRLREDEEEIVAAAAAAEARAKGEGGSGKGKGSGKTSKRAKEAEERHVRRQEDGRGK